MKKLISDLTAENPFFKKIVTKSAGIRGLISHHTEFYRFRFEKAILIFIQT
jgi:hypothetical protein